MIPVDGVNRGACSLSRSSHVDVEVQREMTGRLLQKLSNPVPAHDDVQRTNENVSVWGQKVTWDPPNLTFFIHAVKLTRNT